MKLKNIFIIVILLSAIFVGNAVYAQGNVPPAGGGTTIPPAGSGTTPPDTKFSGLENPLKAKSVSDILYSVVDLVIFIGVIVAVLMFIFIGFKFVLARGNATELAEARKWFLYAVIGTAVLISAKVIVEVVKTTLISTGVVNEKLFNNK